MRFRFRQHIRRRQRHGLKFTLLFWLGLPLCGTAYTYSIYIILSTFFRFIPDISEHLWNIALTFGVLVSGITLLHYVDALLVWHERSASDIARSIHADSLRRPHYLMSNERAEAAKRLENILEELALILKIQAPPAFVLWREMSINACIIGGANNSSAFIITAGALEKLQRSELSALVAHCYAHVYEEDLANHAHLSAMVYAYETIAEWRHGGRIEISVAREKLFRFSLIGNREEGANLLGLLLGGVGLIFSLYGRVLQGAFSRSRKFLADARAIHFTRDSYAMITLLKKALLLHHDGIVARAPQPEWAHIMFLHQGQNRFWASHPSIAARIKILGGHVSAQYR